MGATERAIKGDFPSDCSGLQAGHQITIVRQRDIEPSSDILDRVAVNFGLRDRGCWGTAGGLRGSITLKALAATHAIHMFCSPAISNFMGRTHNFIPTDQELHQQKHMSGHAFDW